jgi:hypothetical protein
LSTGTHTLVFTFSSPVTITGTPQAKVTKGTGSVISVSGSGTSIITVNLTGVTDIQIITVTLNGVSQGPNTSNVSASMGVLAGDVTGNGVVSSTDVNLVKGKNGQTTNASNFRADVTIDGIINGADASFVGNHNGDRLP